MRLSVFTTVVVLIPASLPCAQDGQLPNPSKPRLSLSCARSPCRFRQGETISVDLGFSAEAAGYWVYTKHPDRLELGDIFDAFTAYPAEGAADPAGDPGPFGRWAVASWDPSLDPLSGQSEVKVRVELSQWIRFKKPGSYRVTAVSKRVCTMDGPYHLAIWDGSNCAEVTSGPIAIEIVAAGE